MSLCVLIVRVNPTLKLSLKRSVHRKYVSMNIDAYHIIIIYQKIACYIHLYTHYLCV